MTHRDPRFVALVGGGIRAPQIFGAEEISHMMSPTGIWPMIGELNVKKATILDAFIKNLVADKIAAGNLTAEILITTGLFKTANAGQRVEIDNAGVRLHDAANAIVVNLDAALGSGFFSGDIDASDITGSTVTGGLVRTAASGNRIEILQTPDVAGVMRFFSGDIDEGQHAFFKQDTVGAGGARRLRLNLVGPRLLNDLDVDTGGMWIEFNSDEQDGSERPYIAFNSLPTGTLVDYLVGQYSRLIEIDAFGVVSGAYIYADDPADIRMTHQSGKITVNFNAQNTRSGSQTFGSTFTANPIVQLTSEDASVFLCIPFLSASSTTGFSWILSQKDGNNITGDVVLHWRAIGRI